MMAAPIMRVLILLALAACAACVAHSGPMTIPLRWAPTAAYPIPAASADVLRTQKLRVESFADRRDDKAIGKNVERRIHNIEKGDEAWVVSTGDDVAAFLADALRMLLARSNIPAAAGDATRVLRGEVTRFFVTEGERYQGDIVVHFVLEDGSANHLWQGVTEGHVNNFGRSYSPQNYQEALSNAFAEAVTALLGSQDFLKAYDG